MQLVKKPPAVRGTGVRSLGWEGPLEKGKATQSSILAWRIPWTVQHMGSQRVWHDWETFTCKHFFDSLVAQIVKNLHAVWETRAPSLGLEHPLEKEMTIHSSILAWKIPWTEEPQSVRHDWVALLSVFKSYLLKCFSFKKVREHWLFVITSFLCQPWSFFICLCSFPWSLMWYF